ncbi:MAG TPA: hypothetical protein VGU73_02355, partial [Acidimicrobiia bacterium]|nr:hypothetical protein [Acidimicrobiia bacterium]
EFELHGWSEGLLAAELAGFADHVEVLGPDRVRGHLARLGASLIDRYGSPSPVRPRPGSGVRPPVVI